MNIIDWKVFDTIDEEVEYHFDYDLYTETYCIVRFRAFVISGEEFYVSEEVDVFDTREEEWRDYVDYRGHISEMDFKMVREDIRTILKEEGLL